MLRAITFLASLTLCGWCSGGASNAAAAGLGSLTPQRLAAITPNAAQERLETLGRQLAYHDERYFQEAQPEISDFDYDLLKAEWLELHTAFPGIETDYNPAGIGDDRSPGFRKLKHGRRMLSLQKSYSEARFREFDSELRHQLGATVLDYVIEPKFDGIAISALYENGRLRQVVTRGNGTEGDDVTDNVRRFTSLPDSLTMTNATSPLPQSIELRGEITVSLEEFARINRERESMGEAVFANPRNLAAGTLKRQDQADPEHRRLDVTIYGYGELRPTTTLAASQRGFYEQLRAWGVPTNLTVLEQAQGADAAWAAIQRLHHGRSGFSFPTDGVVIKVDSIALQQRLGDSTTAPRWALACKFAPERAETRIRQITIQVGRTGALTPVAQFEPVQLGGTTVSRATLHNRAELSRRDIRIGDTVVVEKAGEIIPAIVSVRLDRRTADVEPFLFPSRCPSCEMPVGLDGTTSETRCTNVDCPAQVLQRLIHFTSTDCVGVKGLGPARLAQLVKDGRIHRIPDIYHLYDPSGLDRPLKPLSPTETHLQREIESSKSAELWRVIYGLGIPSIGRASAQIAAKAAGRLEALIAASATKPETWSTLDPASARALAEFCDQPTNQQIVSDLLACGFGIAAATETATVSRALAGKRLVVTGTLRSLTRTQAHQKIVAHGGRVETRVTALTDLLVVGDTPGGKQAAARKNHIPTITESEFLALIEDTPTASSAEIPK